MWTATPPSGPDAPPSELQFTPRVRTRPRLEAALIQAPGAVDVQGLHKKMRSQVSKWVAGVIRKDSAFTSPELAWGLVFGAAVDLYRAWAFGQISDIPAGATRCLADAATRALFGQVSKPSRLTKPDVVVDDVPLFATVPRRG